LQLVAAGNGCDSSDDWKRAGADAKKAMPEGMAFCLN
jgi:hypothetical protein